jgi:hypothetical protein
MLSEVPTTSSPYSSYKQMRKAGCREQELRQHVMPASVCATASTGTAYAQQQLQPGHGFVLNVQHIGLGQCNVCSALPQATNRHIAIRHSTAVPHNTLTVWPSATPRHRGCSPAWCAPAPNKHNNNQQPSKHGNIMSTTCTGTNSANHHVCMYRVAQHQPFCISASTLLHRSCSPAWRAAAQTCRTAPCPAGGSMCLHHSICVKHAPNKTNTLLMTNQARRHHFHHLHQHQPF